MVTDLAPTEADSPRRTGTHELFFDLVFVYGITQISTLLGHHLQPAGFATAGLVLALMWWVWSQYTWAINAVDPNRPTVTVALLGAAGAAFFCAQAIPDAYGAAGKWFGVAYFVLHAVGLAIYWAGLAALVALFIVGLLYISYFGWVADATEHRLEQTTTAAQARFARNLYTFLHLPIVAGIVCIAVADERIVTHPDQPLAAGERAALALGVGLFLTGFIIGNALTARTVLIERIAAVTFITVVCAAGAHRSALTIGTATVVALAVALITEALRRSRPIHFTEAGVHST